MSNDEFIEKLLNGFSKPREEEVAPERIKDIEKSFYKTSLHYKKLSEYFEELYKVTQGEKTPTNFFKMVYLMEKIEEEMKKDSHEITGLEVTEGGI